MTLRIHPHIDGTISLSDDQGRSIAKVWDFEDAEQTARLLAAAPDLLTALKQALDVLEETAESFGGELYWGSIGAGGQAIEEARAAIDKATGKEAAA